MEKLAIRSLFATIILCFSTGYASAADVSKGKSVFNKCKACHSLVAAKNGIGPSLNGIFGRTAGTAANYKYSKAMAGAGTGGLVWTEKTISEYLVKPRAYLKGTKMTFAGLKKQSDRENLIAFLKEAAK
ncbi:MAG: cytochrome c family protein [Proteobacteria bacterium]|nr:cytochrome c family protein [Pseudomonadota bacterium]